MNSRFEPSSQFSRFHTIATFLICVLPISYFAGKAVIDVNMSLLAVLVLVHSARAKDWTWLRESWVIALGVFWGYMLLRAGFSEHTDKAMRTALTWVRYPLFMVAIYCFLNCRNTLRQFLWVLGGVVLFVLGNIFLQYFTGSDLFGNGYSMNIASIRLTAVTGRPNIGLHLAWVAMPVMMASVMVALKMRNVAVKLICFSLPLVIMLATYMTAERMATLSIGLGAGLMLLHFMFQGRKKLTFIGIPLLAFTLVGAYSVSETLRINVSRTVAVISDFENTSYGKIMINGLGIFESNPVFGVGVREYRYHCAEGKFAVDEICDESGYNRFFHPHNIYVEMLAELGVVGMALFLMAVAMMVRTYLRAPREYKWHPFIVACMLAALVRIFPLGSTPNFYMNWSMFPFWCWMGFALALAYHRVTLFR